MSIIAVNQITDSSGLSAPVFPPGSAQLNPMAGREDKIINGDFNIWQRGTSSILSGYVTADRWQNSIFGGTVTQSRQVFALGDTLGVNQPIAFLRQVVSGQTLAGHFGIATQPIESVRSYAGQTITVLGWARRSSGSTGNMTVEAAQTFGTGGGQDVPVYAISPTTVLLTGSWAPFAVVMSIPSVTGKTLGINGNDALQLNFWFSGGSDHNTRTNGLGLQAIGVDLWGIHIRHGTWTTAATADYRPRDPGTELTLCQRYYESTIAMIYGASVPAGQQPLCGIYFATPKRAVPTFAWGAELQTVNAQSRTVDYITTMGARTYVTATATGNTAYTTYIAFSAEL